MEREKRKKIQALFQQQDDEEKKGRLVEGAVPSCRGEWTRPEREGGEPQRTNNLEEENGDTEAAAQATAFRGATLLRRWSW